MVVLLSAWSVAFGADEADRKPLPEPFVKGELRRRHFGSDRTVRLMGELTLPRPGTSKPGDIDPLERERAVIDLGLTRNPAALALLGRALSDTDWRVRSAAALALCNFTDAEAAELLVRALKRPDSSSDDLAGALRAARRVKWPALSGALSRLLEHPAPTVRAEALNALTDLPEAADAETLGKLLVDDNIVVRLAAARNAALAEPDALLASALAKPARRDVPAVRGLCLAALGRQAPEKYMLLLTAGGSDDNPLVRRGAVAGLTSAGKGERISAFLNDGSTPVRLAAIRGAGKLKRTDCIDRLFKIMPQTPPAETHLAARDSLIQIDAPEITAAKAGRLMEEINPKYFKLLGQQKGKMPLAERQQFRRRANKVRRNLEALSYLLGSAKSTQAYETHLNLLIRVDIRDLLLEQLTVSLGQIGDRRAIGPMTKKLAACADFTEKSLAIMAKSPDVIIVLPEDNSAGLMHAAVAMKVSEALPIMLRFSSMGFGPQRAKRSAWTADMLMPALTDERTRPVVVEELRRQLNWKYAARGCQAGSDEYNKAMSRKFTALRCRFESAKSLGKLKANVALENLRWLLTEDRLERRIMHAAAWAIQEITGRTPHVGLPKPHQGDWIIKDY